MELCFIFNFNTSNVTIQRGGVAQEYIIGGNFNTSNVTIQRNINTIFIQRSRISIHLMLLFNYSADWLIL